MRPALLIIVGFCVLFASHGIFAGPAPEIQVRLEESVQQALANSPLLKTAEQDSQAVKERSDSARGALWPRLTLDGSVRYFTEVAKLDLPLPGVPRLISFGDNLNYSIGPTVTWNLWDSGGAYYSWKSLEASSRSRYREMEIRRQQIRHQARLLTFQVQLAARRVALLKDSVKLAQSQVRDVANRFRAGASSRMDEVTAQQQELSFRSQLTQAIADFGATLRDLGALTGRVENVDLSRPIPASAAEALPDGIARPTVKVNVEAIEQTLREMDRGWERKKPKANLQVLALKESENAFQLSAQAAWQNHLPRVVLSARSSLDYPNGPNLERIHQNAFGVTLSWALFEGGRISHDVSDKRAQALAAETRKQQAQEDFDRDWAKAVDGLTSLRDQERLSYEYVLKSRELRRLVYDSYRSGRSNFLDVESANVREIDSEVQWARNQVQILSQLAWLESMSVQEQEMQHE